MENALGLYDLNSRIRNAVNQTFPATVWVLAEISEIRQNRTGHCYLELIEKDKDSKDIIARSRATVWTNTWKLIHPYFEMITGQVLDAGMKVLLNVSIEFHPLYSFSLNIKDIDPNYTLGDLERQKNEIIQKLEQNGVLEMNKELPFPEPAQKIAVISSPTAAGYGDFMDQLQKNTSGLKFYIKLFPAQMQGAGAVESMIDALERVFQYADFFDCLVLIRGGGSRSDLAAFDQYDLAYHLTQFPLPVLTGIGHDRDDSIADLVAHTHLKTPTAVAEFLIQKMEYADAALEEYTFRINQSVRDQVRDRKDRLQQLTINLYPTISDHLRKQNEKIRNLSMSVNRSVGQKLNKENLRLHDFESEIKHGLKSFSEQELTKIQLYNHKLRNSLNLIFQKKNQKIKYLDKSLFLLDPKRVLERGFSITLKNGKAIFDPVELRDGDTITNILAKGKIISRVNKK